MEVLKPHPPATGTADAPRRLPPHHTPDEPNPASLSPRPSPRKPQARSHPLLPCPPYRAPPSDWRPVFVAANPDTCHLIGDNIQGAHAERIVTY